MRFFYAFLLTCAALAAQAQTNVRAWYAEGQVWVVWELDLPLPETYGIYASPQPFSNIEDAVLLGRPFYLEYLPFALRAQIDSSMNYRIPDGMGASMSWLPTKAFLWPRRIKPALPVQNLPAGMYFLQFSNEQGEGGVLRMLVR